MTSLLLISTDKTTAGFTHHVCTRHIVSRCGRKKNSEEKMRGQEVDEEEKKIENSLHNCQVCEIKYRERDIHLIDLIKIICH